MREIISIGRVLRQANGAYHGGGRRLVFWRWPATSDPTPGRLGLVVNVLAIVVLDIQ